MKVLISGYGGKMGQILAGLAEQGVRGAELVAGVDPMGCANGNVPCATEWDKADTDVDVIIDFSHRANTMPLLDFAVKNNLPLVLATTGQTDEEREAIMEASRKIPLFFTANYSLGVALLIELAKKAAAAMPDAEIEIIEKHHDRKVDAPSGTAMAIARSLQEVRGEVPLVCGRNGMAKRTKDEIGIHAIRMGNIVGEHEVIIGTNSQTITLKHEAHDRGLFAEGALAAAEFLMGKSIGLYDMKSLVSF